MTDKPIQLFEADQELAEQIMNLDDNELLDRVGWTFWWTKHKEFLIDQYKEEVRIHAKKGEVELCIADYSRRRVHVVQIIDSTKSHS